MKYAALHLQIDTFVAKINADNVASRRLFQKLSFVERATSDDDDEEQLKEHNNTQSDSSLLGKPNVFGQIELERRVDATERNDLATFESIIIDRDDL